MQKTKKKIIKKKLPKTPLIPILQSVIYTRLVLEDMLSEIKDVEFMIKQEMHGKAS